MTEHHNNLHLDAETPEIVAAFYEEADAANVDNIGLEHFTSTRTTEFPN
jgi:hypothetical protein